MTREEEIEQSSELAYPYSNGIFTDGMRDCFIKGAEWADEHPSLDTVKKIICYALKYTNIMLAEDLENSVEWELLIKKAMEE